MREDVLRSDGVELLTREKSMLLRDEIKDWRRQAERLETEKMGLYAKFCYEKLRYSAEMGSDYLESEMCDLLLACRFKSGMSAVSGAEGSVDFLADGVADGYVYSLGHVNGWKVSSGILMLRSVGKETWTEFRFISKHGHFCGPAVDMGKNIVLAPDIKN